MQNSNVSRKRTKRDEEDAKIKEEYEEACTVDELVRRVRDASVSIRANDYREDEPFGGVRAPPPPAFNDFRRAVHPAPPPPPPIYTTLHVAHITYDIGFGRVQSLFKPYGPCRVDRLRSAKKNGSYQFTEVTYQSHADATAALGGLHGKRVGREAIIVR